MDSQTYVIPYTVEDLVCFLEEHRWVFVLPQDGRNAGSQRFSRYEGGRLHFELEKPVSNPDGTLRTIASTPVPGAGCPMRRFLRIDFKKDGFDTILELPGKPPFVIAYLYISDPTMKGAA
jgi:hypothetical protein